MSYQIDFGVIIQYWPAILRGYVTTLWLSLACFGIGMVLGLGLALVKMSRYRLPRFLAGVYIDISRGLPLLVRLIWVYYALPIFLGYDISAWLAGFLAFSTAGAAFIAETFRAGLAAVPKGHIEAARALGMSRTETFFRIVLPQALVIMVPPLMNDYISVLKGTALAFVIGLGELMKVSNDVSIHTMRPLEVMTVAAVLYLFLTIPMAMLGKKLSDALGEPA